MRVAAPELEVGDDGGITSFYRGRITDCRFLADPEHYERPRARWVVGSVSGGRTLEIGCGNGGMTALLAPNVDRLVALDVSSASLSAVAALGLNNVELVDALVEDYRPSEPFNWVVMSEVLEHLRRPGETIARCVSWLAPGGSLLVTTPNGHWESNEHLQEFTLESFARLMAAGGAEAVTVNYLRDHENRRRWLVGRATVADRPPAPDDFADRHASRRRRRD